ncbi:hypothetical protein BDV38DRAFT_286616 [Aspergillus pseudotamarii]|uniref:Secreted protein n=1 Tax=Aspergillus pseudotamarii TaxID=132259 RepID=A0A5N6SG82_ASPPS|nr:uncharacterized protein BDV38DRAFT_286616 [Aspergillus pseudotamarii]KAE8133718.1 hypothetical protein BDV38DRAFT_286616 [Aspergillus pseudotamarii]
MKIQTLFSLAAVGLTFATPIHNLEKRDQETCVKEAVQKELGHSFDFLAESNEKNREQLDGFISCIAEDVGQLNDTAELTQNPLEWLQSSECVKHFGGNFISALISQGKRFQESVTVALSESATCFQQREEK